MKRQGFTLIELLVVIVILSILASLILPAMVNARRNALVSAVSVEINQLESAIAQFKVSSGIEPPSSIVLYEVAADWVTYDTAGTNAALVRQIWPQYDFGNHDINGDGMISEPTDKLTGNPGIYLRTGECLVFFLGGVCVTNMPGNIGVPVGFSNNPSSPFDRGGNRTAPLFVFSQARLTDVDGDGWPEFKDSLPSQSMPYGYYSSYDGTGYQEGTEFATTTGFGLTLAYRQDTNLGANNYWKGFSHQIVSPGFDQKYGYGGAWIQNSTTPLAFGTTGTEVTVTINGTSTIIPSPTPSQRLPEIDNITNFSKGMLSF